MYDGGGKGECGGGKGECGGGEGDGSEGGTGGVGGEGGGKGGEGGGDGDGGGLGGDGGDSNVAEETVTSAEVVALSPLLLNSETRVPEAAAVSIVPMIDSAEGGDTTVTSKDTSTVCWPPGCENRRWRRAATSVTAVIVTVETSSPTALAIPVLKAVLSAEPNVAFV